VVAFHGEINMRTLIDIRATVRKILVECPATIVVDLHCCRVDPHLSLAFLPMLQRLARAADTRLLYTVGDDLADRLRRSWARDFIEAYPTLAQAQAAALAPSSQRWFHLRLAAHPTASAEARQQIGVVCVAWGLSPLVDRVRMIVSELVDNAVEHAGTQVDVTVTELRDLLHVRVRDRCAQLPDISERGRSEPPDGSGRRGHGLWLVARSATSWGVRPTDNGKIVWATVRIRPDERRT
jgi:anti-sigma regulatory factor (Ser/Thr protein kinase)